MCPDDHNSFNFHSRPQRPRSSWSAPRIATTGKVQFSEPAQSNPLVSSANKICQSICQTWLWACAEWREDRESRTSRVRPSQRSRFFDADQNKRGLWGQELFSSETSLLNLNRLIGHSMFTFCHSIYDIIVSFCLGFTGKVVYSLVCWCRDLTTAKTPD